MKKYLLSAGLGLGALSCKHVSPEQTNVKQIYDGKSIDALVLNQDLVNAPANCRFHAVNFFNNAYIEGLIRNGAVQGLGTDNPAGKKLIGDGVYYQLIRIISIADWEMQQALANNSQGCLPERLSANFGVLPLPYADALPKPFADDTDKLRKAASIINPALGDFRVGQINGMENPGLWPNGSTLPQDYQKALWEGVNDKIVFANRANNPSLDHLAKAKAMAAAYTPYNISLNAHFPPGNAKGSKLYIEAYLPPFYELETPDEKNISTWRLTPGLKKTPLPKEIDISVARLTHIGYIMENETEKNPIIKMQMYKDFANPNVLSTRITFGRLSSAGTAKGVLPIDFKDYRDALYINFYPNMAIKDSDNAIVRGIKTQFNSFSNNVKVEARIHQLTLNLERKEGTDVLDSTYLKPKFSMKNSDISFRMHRYTSDNNEINAMKAVGFSCVKSSNEQDCWQDFTAYTDLATFVNKDFKGPANGNLGTRISNWFKDVVNDAVRQNVKWVIDWNIEAIEQAIDAEFIQIFEDLVAKQDANNEKVRQRLEEALFSK